MTNAEHDAWARKQMTDAGCWALDPIHNGMGGRSALYYCGNPQDPTSGIYVRINSDNTLLSTGRYSGAIPHIGEADFWATYSGQHDNAFQYAVERLGLSFLLATVVGSSPTRIR